MERNTDNIPELERQTSLFQFLTTLAEAKCITLTDGEEAEDAFFDYYGAGLRVDTAEEALEILTDIEGRGVEDVDADMVSIYFNEILKFPFGLFGG